MRSLASAVLAMTCVIGVGVGAPALAAAETMSTHQAPASMPAATMSAHQAPGSMPAATMGAHQMPASMPAGEGEKDRDDGHDRHHHRHRLVLPFAFFDAAPAPQVIVAQPDASSLDPAPPAPPQAGDAPPCREESDAGVVILRGTGCTRDHH